MNLHVIVILKMKMTIAKKYDESFLPLIIYKNRKILVKII